MVLGLMQVAEETNSVLSGGWWLAGVLVVVGLIAYGVWRYRNDHMTMMHVEDVPVFITEVDREHRVRSSNTRVLGYDEEVNGHTVYEFTSPDYHAFMRDILERVFETGESDSYELPVYIHGQRHWYQTLVTPVRRRGTNKIRRLLLISHDTTRAKRAEIILRGRNHILERLAQGADLDHVLYVLTQHVQETHPGIICSIMLLDDEKRRFAQGIAPNLPDFYIEAITGIEIGPEVGSCGAAAYRGERVVVEDITTHPYWRDYRDVAARADLRACWSEPIRSADGEILGALALYYREPCTPTADDLEFIRTTAHLAGIAIENSRARELVQRTLDFVKRAKQEWESTVDSLTQLIALLDARQQVLRVNRLLETWGLGDVVHAKGLPVGSLFHTAPDADSFQTLLDMAWRRLEQGYGSTFEMDDTHIQRSLLVQVYPISTEAYRSDDVLESYAVIVVTDITQRKQLEQQRLEAEKMSIQIAMEKRVIGMRQDFVSNVSHEFRTPLTIIKSSKDLLERYLDRMTAEQRETHFQRIDEQISLMTEMVDQVLFISQAVENHIELRPRLLDLASFCRDLIYEIRQSTGDTHEVRFNAPSVFEVSMDIRLLRQIISNLLSNAIKYSPMNTPVEMSLAQEGEWALITVRDRGIGIPPDSHERLFEPFYRANNVRDIKGTGLGMTVVKNAVDIQGGTIEFESTPGQETVFYVRLPLNGGHPAGTSIGLL